MSDTSDAERHLIEARSDLLLKLPTLAVEMDVAIRVSLGILARRGLPNRSTLTT